MLLEKPLFYYGLIKERFPKSYLAEDTTQTIIGIDCEYIDGNECDFGELVAYFCGCSRSLAPFAGLFGVFGYESVNFFENIGQSSAKQYEFPKFFYANARAYLHFDKMSKIYTFYGDEAHYYDFLQDAKPNQDDSDKKRSWYKISTDLENESAHFQHIVAKAKEYIATGDIFQVVLSEQLKLSTNMPSIEFYEYLSELNPSPYMFHFPTPYGDVVGSSPELVFELKNGQIFSAPIAGTRPRGDDAVHDQMLEQELLSDEKELAEHKMLIDLARNDIGRVAKARSVAVKNAMHIQRYQSVMHIVSEVYGQKRDELSAFDVLASIFPAGTLSGTPKIRAMQIICELESFSRGAYGGGIGFINFNSNALIAILIRSACFVRNGEFNDVFVQAGAGIVYDSVPSSEYAEICHKRSSVMRVFKDNCEEIL